MMKNILLIILVILTGCSEKKDNKYNLNGTLLIFEKVKNNELHLLNLKNLIERRTIEYLKFSEGFKLSGRRYMGTAIVDNKYCIIILDREQGDRLFLYELAKDIPFKILVVPNAFNRPTSENYFAMFEKNMFFIFDDPANIYKYNMDKNELELFYKSEDKNINFLSIRNNGGVLIFVERLRYQREEDFGKVIILNIATHEKKEIDAGFQSQYSLVNDNILYTKKMDDGKCLIFLYSFDTDKIINTGIEQPFSIYFHASPDMLYCAIGKDKFLYTTRKKSFMNWFIDLLNNEFLEPDRDIYYYDMKEKKSKRINELKAKIYFYQYFDKPLTEL